MSYQPKPIDLDIVIILDHSPISRYNMPIMTFLVSVLAAVSRTTPSKPRDIFYCFHYYKDAMLNRFHAICNCCSCCCGAMQAHQHGTPMLASSGYVALLKEHGHGLGERSAGRIVMAAGCTFATNDPAAVMEAAGRGRALCLLTHPGREDGLVTYDVQLLDQLRQEVPIDGLEVYYPVHTPAQTAMYREYAQRHRSLTSADSDSHGPDRPPIKYRAELSRGLLERIDIQVE